MASFKNSNSDVRERLEFMLQQETGCEQTHRGQAREEQPWSNWTGLDSAVVLAISLALVSATAFAHHDGYLADIARAIPSTGFAIEQRPATPISASNSLITGVVDPITMTSSFYWTFSFKSNTGMSEEATADIVLPEGALVSRATLWVNGVPQEAAFNSTSAVSNAYEEVAHPTQWTFGDPLLVTWKAPNRVSIKASPVPAGGEMQIRLGITAPLKLDADGMTSVHLPSVENSNFNIVKQDVHVQSASMLSSPQPFVRVERNALGRSVLKANTAADKLSDLVIKAPRPVNLLRVATRATHAGKPSYIVATLKDDEGEPRVELTRQDSEPGCRIITSDHAAFRLSGLWAKQEIDRLLAYGQTDAAIEVGTIYRVVSQVTGATVLEQNNQYSQYGLHRNRYMVLNDYAVTGGGLPDAFSAAPMLQGAVNGTIGPQGAVNGTIGPQAADTAVVQGVNTSGVVRVNYLVGLEALLKFVTSFIQLVGLLAGSTMLFHGGIKRCTMMSFMGVRVKWSPAVQILIATALIAVGLATPGAVDWLIGCARDTICFG